jgi:hypothetical protein
MVEGAEFHPERVLVERSDDLGPGRVQVRRGDLEPRRQVADIGRVVVDLEVLVMVSTSMPASNRATSWITASYSAVKCRSRTARSRSRPGAGAPPRHPIGAPNSSRIAEKLCELSPVSTW